MNNFKKTVARLFLYGTLGVICWYTFDIYYDPAEVEISTNKLHDIEKYSYKVQYSSNRSKALTIEKFKDRFEQSLKPIPDTRFLNALAYHQKVINPSTEDFTLDASYDGDKINFKLKDKLMFTVSRFMGADEYFSQAESYFKELNSNGKFKLVKSEITKELLEYEKDIDSFYYVRVVDALFALSKMNHESPSNYNIFRLIGKATTVLALHTSGYFISDNSLQSKALAMFSVLKMFDQGDLGEMKIWISYLLGYESFLIQAEEEYKGDEFYKLLLKKNRNELEKYVFESKKDLRAVYFYLQGFRTRNNSESEMEYALEKLLELYGPDIIPAASRVLAKKDTFYIASSVLSYSGEYALSVIDYLSLKKDEWQTVIKVKIINAIESLKLSPSLSFWVYNKIFPPKSLAQKYITAESDLKLLSAKFKNRLFSESDFNNFFHSLMYDPLAIEGKRRIQVQWNKKSAEDYLTKIKEIETPFGSLYKKFYEAYFNASFTVPNGYYALDSLTLYPDIAIPALFDIFLMLNYTFSYHSPHVTPICMMLNSRFDTRPEYLPLLLKMHSENIYNPEIIDRILKTIYKHDPEGHALEGYKLRVRNNEQISVEEIENDQRLTTRERYDVVKMLNNISQDSLRLFIEKTLEDNPQDFELLKDYVSTLVSEKRFQEAIDFLLRHRTQFSSSGDLSESKINAYIAEYYLELKEYEKADEAASDAARSYSGNGLYIKAKSSEALKKHEEAIGYINKMRERYRPRSHSRTLAKNLIFLSKEDDALKLLQTDFIDTEDTETVFEDLAKDLIELETLKEGFVLESFLKKLFSEKKWHAKAAWLSKYLSLHGKGELAIKLIEDFHPEALRFPKSVLSDRYTDNWESFTKNEPSLHFLRDAFLTHLHAGKVSEGINYIVNKVGVDYIPFILIQFKGKRDEMVSLFKSITNKNDGPSQFASLIFADFYLAEFSNDNEMKVLLENYFDDEDIHTYYYEMGRFMLFGSNFEALKKAARREVRNMSMFYFLGRYYDSKNDLLQANSFYYLAHLDGTYSNEFFWVSRMMQGLVKRNRNLLGISIERKNMLDQTFPAANLQMDERYQNLLKTIESITGEIVPVTVNN